VLVSLVAGFRWLGHADTSGSGRAKKAGMASGSSPSVITGAEIGVEVQTLPLGAISISGAFRKLISTDDIDGRVMALDQGRCTCFSPVTMVGLANLLDRVSGPDSGKAHIDWRTGHLPPPSVAFEGRKNARLYWVS
jgi:hypothetical protein